jgi:hypothetical protein
MYAQVFQLISWLLRFPTKIFCAFLVSIRRVTCHVLNVLLNFIAVIGLIVRRICALALVTSLPSFSSVRATVSFIGLLLNLVCISASTCVTFLHLNTSVFFTSGYTCTYRPTIFCHGDMFRPTLSSGISFLRIEVSLLNSKTDKIISRNL